MDNSNGGRRTNLARVGLIVALLCGACGDQRRQDNAEPTAGHSVDIVTADLSTGTRTVTITLRKDGSEVSSDLLAQFAPSINVKTWPEGDVVAVTRNMSVVLGGGQLPNGAQLANGYGQIDVQLDDTLDGSAWYSVSIASLPLGYRWDQSKLFVFDDASMGIRVSPAHSPVVRSILSCQKDVAVAVYVSFSEPVTSSDGAIALGFGAEAIPCSIGDQDAGEVQFICSGAGTTGPFSLRVDGSVVAQMSGSPILAGTFHTADMQLGLRSDGCHLYKPIILGT